VHELAAVLGGVANASSIEVVRAPESVDGVDVEVAERPWQRAPVGRCLAEC
jgi:hypothetical protein